MLDSDNDLPDLHDCKLIGIIWAGPSLTLTFDGMEHGKLCIQLNSVMRFRLNDLLEGNIVDEVLLFDQSSVKVDAFRSWIERLHLGAVLSTDHPAYKALAQEIDQINAEIQEGISKLFVMSSSYGCEIVALVESASVSRWK